MKAIGGSSRIEIKKIQPKKVQRILCPKCGELMVKVYPWASLGIQGSIEPCNRCKNKLNSSLKSGVA